MERKTKIIIGLVGAALLAATASAAAGRRKPDTIDVATRALYFGAPQATERAARLARTSAEAAHEIGRLAEATNVDPLARDRAIEALARANTAGARNALRHALSSPAVRAAADYPMLAARLGHDR